ncbi:MAG: hypothetical protein ACK559_10125, partial [bacterium]
DPDEYGRSADEQAHPLAPRAVSTCVHRGRPAGARPSRRPRPGLRCAPREPRCRPRRPPRCLPPWPA